MKDQLENFIHQNKAKFDEKDPSGKVWTNIRASVFSTTSLWNSVVIWRAAAVILLGLCVYLLVPKVKSANEKNLALTEFNDIESFYVSQISEKVNQIEGYKGHDGLNGFTHDFQQLDAMYQVLREEMKLHPGQKVKDALVLNLLIRIDLLNQQLHKIEEGEKVAVEKSDVNV